jgi:tRNA 2-thiouridine synthesizing protein A
MSTTAPSSTPSLTDLSSSGDSTLDLRGEVCPYTFVRARLHLESLAVGAVVTILIDHPPAARNLPRSLRAWGQQVIAVEAVTADVWQVVVRSCGL